LRELTPAQHARIRRGLALIPVCVWFVYGWISLFVPVSVGLTGLDPNELRDFATFYVQGIVANEHDTHALYDIDEQAAILRRVVPGAPTSAYPPVHGPQIALFFAPFARLPYATAVVVWQTLSVLMYAACAFALWRVCPRLRDRWGSALLLVVAAPALRFELGFAQTSAIGLLLVTAAFFALRANRLFLAGLAIGSLAYKPQLGLAAAVVFIGAREWKIVLGAIVAAAAQLLAGGLYWGPGVLVAYVSALRRLPDVLSPMEWLKFDMHSWRSFFELTGLPPGAAMTAYVIAAAITGVIALASWRAKGPLVLRYSVFLVATVLVNPHMWVYDFMLLTPVFLLLWDWALEQGDRTVADVFQNSRHRWIGSLSFSTSFQWLLYFCYVSPLLGILATVVRLQLSVLALSLLGLVLARFLFSSSRAGVMPALEAVAFH
jgi:hypothetical protein